MSYSISKSKFKKILEKYLSNNRPLFLCPLNPPHSYLQTRKLYAPRFTQSRTRQVFCGNFSFRAREGRDKVNPAPPACTCRRRSEFLLSRGREGPFSVIPACRFFPPGECRVHRRIVAVPVCRGGGRCHGEKGAAEATCDGRLGCRRRVASGPGLAYGMCPTLIYLWLQSRSSAMRSIVH
jgi:hypothetical protein